MSSPLFSINCAVSFHLLLNLNGVFRVQALREIEVQINTSCEKEIFYHFQISATAVSAIEGHSYFSTFSFRLFR